VIDTLVLPPALHGQLIDQARAAFPRECCGLVEGTLMCTEARVLAVHASPNLATAIDRFEIDHRLQFALSRRLRGSGREIIGCYHSHPNGHPVPSPRDAEMAREPGFLWLIVALGGPTGVVSLSASVKTGAGFLPLRFANVA
jgi:proteasome lid subunit RPN8/RPN11